MRTTKNAKLSTKTQNIASERQTEKQRQRERETEEKDNNRKRINYFEKIKLTSGPFVHCIFSSAIDHLNKSIR